MWKTEFLINSIYLVFSSLEMHRRLIQTKAYYKFVGSDRNETTYKLSKEAAARTFSPVRMLLVKLASKNVFYSM